MTHKAVPGATLGMLGDGQLGRMFAIAARRRVEELFDVQTMVRAHETLYQSLV